MKVTSTYTEDQIVQLSIEIDKEEIESNLKKVAQNINKRYKFPGFRPGKAPLEIIKAIIGEDNLYEEAIDILIKDNIDKIIEQVPYRILSPGNLKETQKDDPTKITLIYEVPLAVKIDIGDYKSIHIPYTPPVVSEDDIQKHLKELQLDEMILEPVDRPSQQGDHLTIRLEGKEIQNGNDQEPLIIKETNIPITISSEEDDVTKEYPFPGFSRNLIGLSVSDGKVLTHTYPECAPIETFRGKTIEFTVHIEKIAEPKLPPLDDEFAASVKGYSTLEELKNAIRQELQDSMLEEYEEEFRKHVEDKLIEISSVFISPDILEKEVEKSLFRIENYWMDRGLTLKGILTIANKSIEEFKENLKQETERELKLKYIFEEIAHKENITVDEDEINRKTNEEVKKFLSSLTKKQVKKIDTERLTHSILEDLKKDKINETVWQRLKEMVTKPEKETVS